MTITSAFPWRILGPGSQRRSSPASSTAIFEDDSKAEGGSGWGYPSLRRSWKDTEDGFGRKASQGVEACFTSRSRERFKSTRKHFLQWQKEQSSSLSSSARAEWITIGSCSLSAK